MFNLTVTINRMTMVDYSFLTSHSLLILFSNICSHNQFVCKLQDARKKKCNAKGGLTNVSSANERLLGDKCNAKLMRSKIDSYS